MTERRADRMGGNGRRDALTFVGAIALLGAGIVAIALCVPLVAAAVRGGALDGTQSETDLLRETWGTGVPAGAEVTTSWSDGPDFHGDADSVYAMSVHAITTESTGSAWSTGTLPATIPPADRDFAVSVIASSGAPVSAGELAALRCYPRMRHGDNEALLCRSPEAPTGYFFERRA